MRITLLLFTAFCALSFTGIDNEEKIIGCWDLRLHILNGDTCTLNKVQLIFNSDHTYKEIVNGYWSKGKWKLEGNKISYYNSVLQNPKDGSVADHSYTFHFSEKGELVEDDYMCSELIGVSYYRKSK